MGIIEIIIRFLSGALYIVSEANSMVLQFIQFIIPAYLEVWSAIADLLGEYKYMVLLNKMPVLSLFGYVDHDKIWYIFLSLFIA